ncbi:MAG: DMT family transporter [Methanobacteriota archaeon]
MINKPVIALFISIISVSFAAIFIVSCTAPALSIAFYRLFFTTLLLIPFILIHKKTRRELCTLEPTSILLMTLIGVILAAHFALWITSLTLTSVASSVILVTAHPIIVGPISHILFKEKLSPLNITGIVLSVFGVAVLVSGNYNLTQTTLQGNILAMLGGIAAGLYILGGRKMRKTISVATYAFIVYGIGTLTLLLFCIIFHAPIYNLSAHDYGLIFLMAIISGICGHTLYNWSLRHIRASVASVALLGEPIGSSLLAYIIPWIHQQPSQYTLSGGCIILLGIYFTAKQKNSTKDNRKPLKLLTISRHPMPGKNNTQKIITFILIAALIISTGIILYINLPKQETPNENEQAPISRTPILTLTYETKVTNYTLQELDTLEAFTGMGGYRTQKPSFKGIGNYTGVPINILVQSMNITEENYSLKITSYDGEVYENQTYNHSVILGNVDIYNPENVSDANPISKEGLTMVLAYKYEGEYFNTTDDGNLKIAFLDENGSITYAGLWWKYVVAITITPE